MNAMHTIRFHSKFLLLVICAYLGCKDVSATDNDPIFLDEMPEWILKNIRFPEDAYKYGYAGKEQFVISIDWAGRVFITSGLNTLHPSFRREIENVINRAPKCHVKGISNTDLYKAVEIDFAGYADPEKVSSIINIGEYRFPRFPENATYAPHDSREDFVDWLTERYKLPKGIKDYQDTVVISYVISKDGKIKNVGLEDVHSEIISDNLNMALKKAPSWKPAETRSGEKIEVYVSDNVIIRIKDGKKLPSVLLQDKSCRNSSEAPEDSDMVVLNPEVMAAFDGQHSSMRQLLQESIRVSKRVRYSTTMVIEKDGKVGEFHVDSEDDQIKEELKDLISTSQWIPACQGGISVNTIYSFSGTLSPQTNKAKRNPDYSNRFASFMVSDRHRPFYDPDYEAALQRRWRKLVKVYPAIESDIDGYSKFRRMSRETYIGLLLRHGGQL